MAFDFYFAGTQSPESLSLQIKLNANILKSYVNDKQTIQRIIEYKKQGDYSGKLLIDSGAFTAMRKDIHISIDDYIDWINTNSKYLDLVIELDDIPGKWGKPKTIEEITNAPKNTWKNYLYMVSKLKQPEKLLPVFHQYEDFKYLQQMLDYRLNGEPIKYICISGNKEKTAKHRKEWYDKCFSIIKNSSNPNVKVHCLGSATLTDMQEFPFTSSDATSWIMTSASGSILTQYGPINVSSVGLGNKDNIKNRTSTEQNIIRKLCDKYNINFDDLCNSYIARSNFNINYLYESSKNTDYRENKINRKDLF